MGKDDQSGWAGDVCIYLTADKDNPCPYKAVVTVWWRRRRLECGVNLCSRHAMEAVRNNEVDWFEPLYLGGKSGVEKYVDLGEALDEVNARFEYGPGKDDNPLFWLNMAESQIQDARNHLATGQVKKALNEIADLVPVAYDALEKLGERPAQFITARIKDRILPRVAEVHSLYDKGDGHRAHVGGT